MGAATRRTPLVFGPYPQVLLTPQLTELATAYQLDGACFESRMFASQGIPWDLMSLSFHSWKLGSLDPPESRKPAV